MVVSVKNANMVYQRKSKMCVKCGKTITGRKNTYCSTTCELKSKKRYRHMYYAKRGVFKGQCTENVTSNHGVFKCPNEGLPHKEGMCLECYNWNLKRLGIYPHKDNETSCTEVYLVL